MTELDGNCPCFSIRPQIPVQGQKIPVEAHRFRRQLLFRELWEKAKDMNKCLWSLLLLIAAQQCLAQKSLKVYVFLAEECPISIYMVQPLRKVAGQFNAQADFYAVFTKRNSNPVSSARFVERYGLEGFSRITDNEQKLARKLGGSVTPEVVVTDAEDRVLYRGRISNAYAAPGKMKHGSRVNELEKATGPDRKRTAGPHPLAKGCRLLHHLSQQKLNGPRHCLPAVDHRPVPIGSFRTAIHLYRAHSTDNGRKLRPLPSGRGHRPDVFQYLRRG